MSSIYLRDKMLWQITLLVLIIHGGMILSMISLPFSKQAPRQYNERLAVHTIQLTPPGVQAKSPLAPSENKEKMAPNSNILPSPKPSKEIAAELITSPPPLPLNVEEMKPSKTSLASAESNKKIAPPPSPDKKSIKALSPTASKKTPNKKAAIKKENAIHESTHSTTGKPSLKKDNIKKSVSPASTAAKAAEKKPMKALLEKSSTEPQPKGFNSQASLEVQEKKKKLLATAQASIAKLEQNRAHQNASFSQASQTALASANAIPTLQIDNLPIAQTLPSPAVERSYRDELASRLKLLLKLPEHGEVQLKLTVDRLGRAIKVNVIKSPSHLNRLYVEKNLPMLKFPPLGREFAGMPEYTFIIQLSNEL
ncbi:hypothetical protein NEOC84_000028|uniref:hypothetical protein n=1 Tax=Neochlamydia sp. AcF84 TaxID=2315858 RepID=UPI00140B813F|nr:hypothetical protein [Neochlamydia sp. AcF84]NGY94174.1 hypothetical protein [Neochlamydia sp. AcF84]